MSRHTREGKNDNPVSISDMKGVKTFYVKFKEPMRLCPLASTRLG